MLALHYDLSKTVSGQPQRTVTFIAYLPSTHADNIKLNIRQNQFSKAKVFSFLNRRRYFKSLLIFEYLKMKNEVITYLF